MKSLSSVGLGLSIVFGCLLLALLAEVYYLLWWKKRLTNRDIENDYSNPAREFLYMFCWKRSSSSNSMSQTAALNPQGISSSNLLLKPADFNSMVENNNNNHLLHHSLNSGPPRFLFTIIEETKEDLESEEAKSKCDIKSRVGSRGRSLSDLLLTVETPYLTPLASPPFFTPPLTPMEVSSGCNYSHQLGFNPLFESVTDAEFNRIKSSPPPKFKFLQEAEEKLHRKKMMEENEEEEEEEEDENGDMTPPSKYLKDEEDGSFITIIVDRSKEIRGFNHQCSSAASSQVLPLSSSPSTLIKSPV